MKKKLFSLLVALVAVFTLAGCGGKETSKYSGTEVYADTIGIHYSTLNYLVSQSANDSVFHANMVEGLVEADNYGRIVPLGAKSWENKILDNGKQVWTFHLRDDVQWFDPANDMAVYGTVKAQDYVEGIKYILNPTNASSVGYLVTMFIDGAQEYQDKMAAGEKPDFDSMVGAKAIDDFTLEYTLPVAMSYFPTVLTYSAFNPVNGEYLKSQGVNFGTSKDTLLCNGPYYMTVDEKNSKVFLEWNPEYWNADMVEVKELQFIFVDPTAGADWGRMKYENGELSAIRIAEDDIEGWKQYITGPDGTGTPENPYSPYVYTKQNSSVFSYGYFLSPGRYYVGETAYQRTSHPDEASRINTMKALSNKDFRLGIQWGLDVTQFNQRYNPNKPDQRTRNIYTPGGLAWDENGKDYIEYYYEEFAAQEGITPAEAAKLLADGNDYYEDDAKANAYFEAAKAELDKQGVTFPVTIDFLASVNQQAFLYQKAMIDKMNKDFGQYVNIIPVELSGQEEYQNLYGANNWDLYGMTGWGADYGDPYAYAQTFELKDGAMLDFSGLAPKASDKPEFEQLRQDILGEYDALVQEAKAVVDENKASERFAKFAKAEYVLLNETGLFIPAYSVLGDSVNVSKVIPNCLPDVMYGNSSQHLKWLRIHDGDMTPEIRQAYIDEHNANRPK